MSSIYRLSTLSTLSVLKNYAECNGFLRVALSVLKIILGVMCPLLRSRAKSWGRRCGSDCATCHSLVTPKTNYLLKFVTFAYELRFLRSLYPRVGENIIYNFHLDFIGKF